DPDKKIFLISLKAGGVGLNLTAADYIFILDPWWNPAAEMQAASRAHRIGQTKKVFVYRFISRNTVEEKIISLQSHKENLAHEFVNSNNPMVILNKEQIMSLVE
ncbi:C-terminal helicase domain-containing protein, partial [Tenuifilum sp.]|uniref:helicase-related protein n=1 Tax=Tenuifilum sp. TaxID=2760880 RepID=UPI00258B4ECC